MTAPVRDGAPHATLVTATAAETLGRRPLDPYEGVDYKPLWRSGKSVTGPGEAVGPGTYVHIPTGVTHSIRAVGDGPASVLYLSLRDEPGGGT
jgi:hypothetical protein